MNQPELLFRQPNELSEGPVWDDRTSTLYWVDALAGAVWRSTFSGATASPPEAMYPSSFVSAVGLTEDHRLVAALADGLAWLTWGEPAVPLLEPSFNPELIRYNDGKPGPDGAFWVGSKDRAHQSGIAPLERLAKRQRTVVEAGLTISNGLDWSPDEQWFYLADSIPRVIWRYRYDAARGRISDRERFCDGTEAPGVPDGLAVDAEGCLWSARWAGSQLVRLSPKGEVLARVAFPVSRVSSCAFGGPDLRTLFVTTAKEDLSADERRVEVLSGSIFQLKTDVPGRKAYRFTL